MRREAEKGLPSQMDDVEDVDGAQEVGDQIGPKKGCKLKRVYGIRSIFIEPL